ncbi:MAG: hypothetical protein RLZZ450_1413, partial [Pseudomonadota bacterium]|jgi:hypothetical protein
LLWTAIATLAWGLASGARAQEDARFMGLPPGGPGREPIDTTRLDVDRLPNDVAPVTRDLYDRGLFLEAHLGGLTFAGDARKVSRAGPRLAIALGYELTRWFAVLGQVEGSLHQTDNRTPPARTAYQLAGAVGGIRFSVPINASYALWVSGLVGCVWSSGDVLRALDFRDAFKLSLNYGGELGFDWHLRARHHSLGLLAGARHLPSLERDGFTVGAYGAGYLRYVF